MALTNIATITISKEDAMASYFSREYLYKTQKDPEGPLGKIVEWMKAENLYFFDIKHMKLGKDEDDYVFIYYHDGVRYKLLKTGIAVVSSADADDMMEFVQKDLQRLVDTILDDELIKSIRAAFMSTEGLGVGKVKHLDADGGAGKHTMSMMGARTE